MKRYRFLLLATAATLPTFAADRWFEIRLSGQPTGYYFESEEKQASGTRSVEAMLFVMNRLGSKVEIKTRSETLEDAAGMMVSVESEVSSSAQTTMMKAKRIAGAVDLESITGGKRYTRVIPAAEPLFGPKGVEHLTLERLNKPGDRFSYDMFAPELGGVGHFTRTLDSRDGATLRVEEETAGMPGKTILSLGCDGNMVERKSELPFGQVVIEISNRETALRAAQGSELKNEIFGSTLARSNVRLPDPRSIERVRLKLTHHRPDLGWPPFDGENQKIIEKTANTVILEITRPVLEPNHAPIEETAFLKPNAILQSDDTEVTRLAHTIVGDERDRFKAARKLQDWAAQNLKLDLGVALAPASEVARNRGGTCAAYAVLLASLERAAGIPSRFAMGYVYVDGIWGGHAWTEVLVNGQWIPLDAAAYAPGIADAARFQFGSYTLEDNMSAAVSGGARLYGNLDVAVLEYTLNGRTYRVPEDAKPYNIAGDEYRNPWMGFAVHKHEGARFAKLDAVYPDSTIVAIEAANAKLEVEQDPPRGDVAGESIRIDGREAHVVSSPGKVVVRIVEGNSMWVLTAEGPDAKRLMDETVAGWKWISAQ
ncbi:MAG: transglutaminase domain-containing protein [Bryobacteraceae bacterium]|jgi:hypothetical protein